MIIERWADKVVFSPDGPQPQFFAVDDSLKLILGGLEPGQTIPPHPEGAAVYYFLTGRGQMHVDGEWFPVEAGVTVITRKGAIRGLTAETQLAFMATRAAD